MSSKSSIDWRRIYPHPTHRWSMSVRPGNFADYFAVLDANDAVRAERTRWLAEDAATYAAMLPSADVALRETADLARSLGASLDPTLPASELLLELGRAWEPDFVWMHPDGAGSHRLTGGVVCFPSMWALQDKIGRTMHDVHDPVPELNATLGRPIESYLARQQPGDVWERENVNFSRDAELNHHPSSPHRAIDATITAEEFWIRFEHQLLLKLPKSGSILFGIRIELIPLSEILFDAHAAQRLAAMFVTMSPAAAEYKGIASARAQLVAMCSQCSW